MPRKNRKTAVKSSEQSTHSSQAAMSSSEKASVLTKGKSFFKRILHRRVDKEKTKTPKESSGTGNVNEQENEEPIATSCEDAQATAPQTSAVATGSSDASTEKDKGRSTPHEAPVQSIDSCIQDAKEKISNIKCISGPVEIGVNAIGSANTTMTQLDTINSTYLQPLHIFNAVATGIAEVHPYAQLALSVLTTASSVILSQANLDASITNLVIRIKQTYELILENESPAKINATKDVLLKIAQVIQECARFIEKYSETTNFWRRLGKNIFSETTAKVTKYNTELEQLMQELRDRSLLDAHYGVQQIREDLSLDSLVCAGQVGLNTAKKCLDGTRTGILNEVVDWINSTDPAAPRIFWLHGQAGKGKSAIAHTVALQARNLGVLGSCFCFTRVRQHEGLHTKLFPTIARDLADRDLRLRPLLAQVISTDHSLRDTADIAMQWQKFIIEPLSRLEGSSTGNVVVVIDALDESATKTTRAPILEALAAHGAKLPATIRILLTSRPLVDIQKMLNATEHIHARSLDDIDAELMIADIRRYVSYRLKGDPFSDEKLQHLATKSDGVFEWARLACDFVSHDIEVIAQQRLDEILSRAPGDGRTLLDEIYVTFLKEFTGGQSDVLRMFRSVMRQILWLKEPLPISALDFMRARFPRKEDRYKVGDILKLMASLLSGANEMSTPVRPLHASFYDFLLDKERSGEFYIPQDDVHHDLAVTSLSVMQAGLQFNICGLETSYVANSEVSDLDKRVEENIPSYLMYACQFWAAHLQGVPFDVKLAELVGQFVTGKYILFWLEALGISKLIGSAYWALRSAEEWFQGQMGCKEILRFIKDEVKFVENFAGLIGKSTPHLYLSALPFSPCKSVMAKYLVNDFPGIARVTRGLDDDWPTNQHVLQGHTNGVWSVAFSPDGRHIVSGSSDKTIQVWDAQTGGQVGNPLQGPTDSVLSVASSSEGSHIMSCSHSDQISQVCGYEQAIDTLFINFSSSAAHALQHHQSLYIDMPSGVGQDYQDLVKFHQYDGWIVGPDGKLLIWIPPSYHSFFHHSSRKHLIIPKGSVELDLSRMRHGPVWHECYSVNTVSSQHSQPMS